MSIFVFNFRKSLFGLQSLDMGRNNFAWYIVLYLCISLTESNNLTCDMNVSLPAWALCLRALFHRPSFQENEAFLGPGLFSPRLLFTRTSIQAFVMFTQAKKKKPTKTIQPMGLRSWSIQNYIYIQGKRNAESISGHKNAKECPFLARKAAHFIKKKKTQQRKE